MLEINPGLILWTIITFIILLVVLRAVAWKPLLGALTAREEKTVDRPGPTRVSAKRTFPAKHTPSSCSAGKQCH